MASMHILITIYSSTYMFVPVTGADDYLSAWDVCADALQLVREAGLGSIER